MSYDKALSLTELKQEASDSNWIDRVQLLESVVSTQEEAKRLAESGAPEGTTVIAEEQTGARGEWAEIGFLLVAKGFG